jgi:hypothetical protein
MKFLARFSPLFLFVFLAPSAAFAQRTMVNSVGWEDGVTTVKVSAPDSCEWLSVITGVPVSYQRSQDNIHVLADGTRLTHTSMIDTFYRDSVGRIHIENPVSLGRSSGQEPRQIRLIKIQDPSTGFQYILDSTNHVAYRFSFMPCDPSGQENSGNSRSGAKASPTKLASTAAHPDPIQRSRESLGTQMFEGIAAEGTRITTVYPVGLFGNDRPITRVCESWYPDVDLGTAVLSKCSDPRFGNSTMRMENISLTEPDPTLFQVPAGYSTVDGHGDVITMKFQSPQ